MDNAFVTWAKKHIDHIDGRLPWLENRLVTMHEMRDGQQVDTTQELVEELKRQKAELFGLIAKHEND